MAPRSRIAAGILLAEAVALGLVLLVAGRSVSISVVTHPGSSSFFVARVDVGVAVIVTLLLGAAGQLVSARLRWVETALTAPIVIFLLAGLNGIRELGTLVAIYALTSATVLFGVLHVRRGSDRTAGIFGAMVGIVPWGLIAWYQITPGVLGEPVPAVWVRVLTLVMLALFAACGVMFWRRSGGSVLGVVTRSAIAVGVAVAIAAGLPIA